MIVLLVHPDDDRREALGQAVREAGWVASAIAGPEGFVDGLVPDAVVLSPALSLADKQAVIGRIGPVPQVLDDGDTSAVTRQISALAASARPVVALGGGTVDLRTRTVLREGQALSLTEREAALLAWFIARAGAVVPRGELLVHVWGYRADMATRTVDVTVARLRDKIEADASAPEHLLTVRGEGYRFVLPAPVEPSAPEGLVGRRAELERLGQELGSGRVVTLMGPGGVGKTTLARVLAERRPGAVWVDLVPAGEGEVIAALARALGLPAAHATGGSLGRTLRNRGVPLLVLDNVEHVAREVAPLVSEILAEAPSLAVLATGRTRLRVPVELLVELGSLPEPEAVALLVKVARTRVPGWGEGTDGALARVARALEGNALAIELAAARARLFAPEDLAERLEASLDWLRNPDRGARRASLLDAIAWSWKLLDPDEQRALAWLSVFRGGFTADAAEAVLGGAPGEALDLLDRLAEHCLVHGSERFSLHVGVGEFARARLLESGEAGARAAHHHTFAAFARRQHEAVGGRPGWHAVLALRTERGNLLQALAWPGPRSGDLARALLHDWELESMPEHEVAVLERVDRSGLSDEQRAEVLYALAWARVHAGRLDAAGAFAEELRDLAGALSGEAAAWASFGAGFTFEACDWLGEARACCEAALARMPGASDLGVRVLLELAVVSRLEGDADTALAQAEQAKQMAMVCESEVLQVEARGILASMLRTHARQEASLAECRAILAIHERHNQRGSVGVLVGMIGVNLHELGRSEEALPYLTRGLEMCREWGDAMVETMCHLHRAGALLALDRRTEALDDALAAVSLARGGAGPRNECRALRVAAECWLSLGEHAEARACIATAEALTARFPLPEQAAPLAALRARAEAG
ncbi:MAG: hypothetical protein EP330_11405 [Deltaproteobacteria bacterium]|nr:MAG: hypothetical protein EP330_11405 [Deltaproteobacteria bacterium]